MSSTSASQPNDLLQVEDVLAAQMPQAHREIVIVHLKRLQSIIEHPRGEDVIARSMQESVAHEQLEKMTKVFRSYEERQQKGLLTEEVESMVADLIDGCILSSLTAVQWEAEFPRGRERERGSSSSKQGSTELDAEAAANTAVLKVRQVTPSSNANQEEADYWRDYFCRPRSQSEVRSPGEPRSPSIIRDRPAYTRKLSERTPEVASGRWPLAPKDEQSYYASGVTGTKGGKEMGWSWPDLLGYREE